MILSLIYPIYLPFDSDFQSLSQIRTLETFNEWIAWNALYIDDK